MSVWRDIWRFGVIANRLYSENKEDGELAFAELKQLSKKDDGMIHFIYAKSLEHVGEKDLAVKEFENARNLFPVDHWKKIADDSIKRLNENQTLDEFYNSDNFNDLLWKAFHKVYDYVNLNDFARYVCLSALARGSSEWPLSLVDFRTVLELQLKQTFSTVITYQDDAKKYSLKNHIDLLKHKGIIDKEHHNAFSSIRIAGNIAAHELYTSEDYKLKNIKAFLQVLDFFNEYPETHKTKLQATVKYPLCQLNIEEYLKKLRSEAKNWYN